MSAIAPETKQTLTEQALHAAEQKIAAAKELIDARQEEARIDAQRFPSSAAERAAADARYMELALVALALSDNA